jgi:hypothetical protein
LVFTPLATLLDQSHNRFPLPAIFVKLADISLSIVSMWRGHIAWDDKRRDEHPLEELYRPCRDWPIGRLVGCEATTLQ